MNDRTNRQTDPLIHAVIDEPARPAGEVGDDDREVGNPSGSFPPESLSRGRAWIKYAFILGTYLAAVYAFGSGWLSPGLPKGDMGGTVAGLALWRHLYSTGQVFTPWNDAWFCGHSRVLFNLDGGQVAYLPFLLFGDELWAVKFGGLTYLALASLSAFILLRYLLNDEAVAYLLGLAYALHPIHLSVAAATSHANFPPFYFLAPLVVWRILCVIDRPDGIRVAWLALVGAIAAWVDFERLAILVPWLAFASVGIGVWQRIQNRRVKPTQSLFRSWLALGLAGILMVALVAVILLPVAYEKPSHALFSEQTRHSSVAFFSIQNPLYYLDRNGLALKPAYQNLPPENAHDAGTFYLGSVLLILAALGIILEPASRRQIILFTVVICGSLALATAQGPFSGYDSLCRILDEVFLQGVVRKVAAGQLVKFVLWIGLVGAALSVVARWCARNAGIKRILLGLTIVTLAAACILFARPFTWVFRHVPPFAEMRNPGWFATSLPPLALVIAAAIGLNAVLARFRRQWVRGIVFALVGIALAWDVWPYRTSFEHRLSDQALSELKSIAGIMTDNKAQGRILSRESYNPHADMLYAYSRRPAAFYWLNWMAPANFSRYMLDDLFSKLHRPETIGEALNLAGWAHVRYVLYDLTEGPPPPPTDLMTEKYTGHYFALYENSRCRPFANLLPQQAADRPDEIIEPDSSAGQGTPPRLTRPFGNEILVELEAVEPSVLMVSESWFPGWQAVVDDQAAAVCRVQKAFLGVPISPGAHRVRLYYPRRWYYHTGAAVSLVALMICVWLLVQAKPILTKAGFPNSRSVC